MHGAMANRLLRRLGRRPVLVAGTALLLAVAGCAKDPEDLPYVERPVEVLYNNALNALEKQDYKAAAQQFDEVERQHPYSIWATKAQLMAAYALYLQNQYTDAVNALDRFLQLHPGHEDAPYALYLKGLSFYERIRDVGRDQGNTEGAEKVFEELVRRFPDTRYAKDAKGKLVLVRDHLAGKEMHVGRYYLKRGEYVAAINRFRRVIEKFDRTEHVPEALHRLSEAYLALGIVDEAKRTAAVLGYNFPRSAWYQDSYRMLASAGTLGDEQRMVAEGGARSAETGGAAPRASFAGMPPPKSKPSFLSRAWNWLF